MSFRFRHWRRSQLGLAFRRQPFFELALGHDPAGRDRVHADIGGAVVARERARQSDHAGFARRVGRHAALSHHPGGRAEIDDDALLGRLHARQHGLCGEELVLEVHRDPVVPILRRHLFGRVPFVMRRVVDEDRDRPVDLAGLQRCPRAAQGHP